MGLAKNFKICMIDKNIKQKDISAKIGKDTQQLYNSLYRDKFITESAYTLAHALDCDIVLMDRRTGKIY